MKKTKLMSIFTAIVMSVSMAFSTTYTSAVDIDHEKIFTDRFNEGDKMYTLEELFAMSDEEFLTLIGFEKILSDDYVSDPSHYISVNYSFYTRIYDFYLDTSVEVYDLGYVSNITEEKIAELLGDTVEYEIRSPIDFCRSYNFSTNNYYLGYHDTITVTFPEYEHMGEFNIHPAEGFKNKEIIELEKCFFCINQVITFVHHDPSLDRVIPKFKYEPAITGDVYVDKKFDLQDVVWLSKGLVKQFKLSEFQLMLADVNEDGRVNVFDVISLSRKLLSEKN